MARHIADYGRAGVPVEADGRLNAVAFQRNHGPIGEVLLRYLASASGDVLEVGSGTGQHAAAFARLLPNLAWWPSDPNDTHLRSIAAWREYAGLANLKPPVRIDLARKDLHLRELGLPSEFAAMFCANVLHIAPWSAAEGLLAGAGRHLRSDGRLFIYGPFRRDGVHNAPSNEAFDAGLRADNPAWGVRDTADLRALGERAKLKLAAIVEMPANNAILVFERPAA